MNNLTQLFEIQKALKQAKYPDYKRISKEIAEYVKNEKDLKRVLNNIKTDKPWEYICGNAEFYTIPFEVNQNVMIPRVETEKLVALAIQEYKDKDFDMVIDIGTGSGCIIISLIKSLLIPTIYEEDIKDTEFIATDKSVKALRVVKKNVKKHDLRNFVIVKKTDTINHLNTKGKKVLLLANLPYIPTDQYEKLDKSVKNYEPKSALEGGEDGNREYKKLAEEIKKSSMKSFTLILETEESIIGKTKKLFKKYSPRIVKDIKDKERFLIVRS